MAPTHSKPLDRKRVGTFLNSPMAKIAKGTAVFLDDFVNGMAEGKKPSLPKYLNDLVVDINDEEEEEEAKVLQPIDDNIVAKKKKIIKCTYDKLEDMHDEDKLCPKHNDRDPFALWSNATHHSDGELNHFNVACQGTESGPCSFCAEDPKTPEASPVKPKTLAQAKGFNVNDCEGEECTPKKISANACKWSLALWMTITSTRRLGHSWIT